MIHTIHLPRLWRNQRGDTMIEVLIAIGIISLVLATAFALTTRNVQGIRAAQEQAAAQKLVEQQVEFLRAATTKPKLADGAVCYSSPSSAFVASTNSLCRLVDGGATYNISIALQADNKTYAVTAVWDTVDGLQANVTVYYRVAT